MSLEKIEKRDETERMQNGIIRYYKYEEHFKLSEVSELASRRVNHSKIILLCLETDVNIQLSVSLFLLFLLLELLFFDHRCLSERTSE